MDKTEQKPLTEAQILVMIRSYLSSLIPDSIHGMELGRASAELSTMIYNLTGDAKLAAYPKHENAEEFVLALNNYEENKVLNKYLIEKKQEHLQDQEKAKKLEKITIAFVKWNERKLDDEQFAVSVEKELGTSLYNLASEQVMEEEDRDESRF